MRPTWHFPASLVESQNWLQCGIFLKATIIGIKCIRPTLAVSRLPVPTEAVPPVFRPLRFSIGRVLPHYPTPYPTRPHQCSRKRRDSHPGRNITTIQSYFDHTFPSASNSSVTAFATSPMILMKTESASGERNATEEVLNCLRILQWVLPVIFDVEGESNIFQAEVLWKKQEAEEEAATMDVGDAPVCHQGR
ncbi:hypothetical protein BD779DRAFT_1553131, partial [Infundibulicybe gibba]